MGVTIIVFMLTTPTSVSTYVAYGGGHCVPAILPQGLVECLDLQRRCMPQWIVFDVPCIWINRHCSLYIIQCKLSTLVYTVQCTSYTVQWSSVQWIKYTILWLLYIVQCNIGYTFIVLQTANVKINIPRLLDNWNMQINASSIFIIIIIDNNTTA